MSIIKLTDPRYCSPLDPPLIPTYPPPAGEGGERSPRISRERDRWKLGHAGDPTCVVSPSIFENRDTRPVLLPAYELQNYRRISGIVPTCKAPPPPLSFSTLGRLHPR